MNRLIMILTMGLLLLLPIPINAQDEVQSVQTNSSKGDNTILVKSKSAKKKATDTKDLNNKEGLYHIVVLTKGHKKESLWVELEHGEQKYITIRLDNSNKKNVSILLNNKKQSIPIKFSPYNRPPQSQLTLQPISF